MSAEERLIRYCRIDTQSDPESRGKTPSAAKEFDLAKVLEKELRGLGLKDAKTDAHCYVYAHLPANIRSSAKTVGFIAHMDTAPDFSGTGVKPRVIRGYDGKDIVLSKDRTMKTADFPQLKSCKGMDLVVAGGDTLLGADDKAGIAIIMSMLEHFQEHPEEPHGRIAVAFTPDEEIGGGTACFDLKKFGADFAYTFDGDEVNVIADETFNAAEATVSFTGFCLHPGSSKNRMINAANIAMEYHDLLPAEMRPEHTEKREGFFHLHAMEGSCEHAQLTYIVRNHDRRQFDWMLKLMQQAADYINACHGKKICEVKIRLEYRNMYEVMKHHPEVTRLAWNAMKEIGLTPAKESIRGGTDGAMLSFKGLPCPNLGTGGGNYHGPYEYLVIDEMNKGVELAVRIAVNAGKAHL